MIGREGSFLLAKTTTARVSGIRRVDSPSSTFSTRCCRGRLRRRNVLIQLKKFVGSSEPRASFALPASFVPVIPEGSAGLGNEFGAAALNKIARFGDNVLQYFDQFADTGFAIYKHSS
jgi:hypothetical protein